MDTRLSKSCSHVCVFPGRIATLFAMKCICTGVEEDKQVVAVASSYNLRDKRGAVQI